MTTENRPYTLLLIILAMTAALWSGVAMIGLNADDYQFIEVLAPIRSFGDVFRAFWIPDANPSYFRPVASALTSLDFLIFHTWGGGYHLTNLLFHLAATALVFFVCRDVFRLSNTESLLATLLFGLLGSHETNLTVDMMRPDAIAAVFLMLALLLETSTRIQSRVTVRTAALLCFAFAVLSKEIAVVTPILLAGVWWSQRRGVRNILMRLVPYAAIGIALYIYHAYFTSQPSELLQSRSAVSLLRNAAFSIGYMILPLDLASARGFMTGHDALLAIVAIACLAMAVFIIVRLDRDARRTLLLPLFFTIITGAVLCLDFQRWRTYLPSVGLVAIAAIIIMRTRKPVRIPLQLLFLALVSFHIWRAIDAQAEFRSATVLLDDLQHSMQRELATVQPTNIGILVSPAKLGSAGVLQVGHDAFMRRADAVAHHPQEAALGLTSSSTLHCWTAVDLYSLHADRGYAGLHIEQRGPRSYSITVPDSGMFLVPVASELSWRDTHLQPGDSITTSDYTLQVARVGTEGITQITLNVHDTLATLLAFDGRIAFRPVQQ